ncbi:MAG TPA: plastocyanin/azurin family copper-binding protein [Acidimicrobiales bacterium]|nr:plastocyanin/azurin family copper-binding protein [Acidimicrobiales bacterium]
MRRVAGAVAAVLGLALASTACAGAGATGVRTVELTVHHSTFSVEELRVRPGETVRFVLRNTDPIPHELIIGDQRVQDVHETGTEAHHAERPGEVSVAPGKTAVTTYRFGPAGADVLFGCHLPGHWAYGMRGTIRVG